nr:MAG: hypothetical protein [Microviridae sp.]
MDTLNHISSPSVMVQDIQAIIQYGLLFLTAILAVINHNKKGGQ